MTPHAAASPVDPCPSPDTVARFIDGNLDEDGRDALDRHLDACARCFELISALADDDDGDERSAPRSVLSAGTAVGHYSIDACIGAGAMGVVYLATDPRLRRRVALKLIALDRFDDRERAAALTRRLRREARAMARLHHPNVVGVLDVGRVDRGWFIAMEWIEGGTLEAWLRQRARPWGRVIDCFLAAGRGLAAAHAMGIVHRDFKPANVLVGHDDVPRVVDFGLARDSGDVETSAVSDVAATEIDVSRDGVGVGTPIYMAPEQMIGPSVDARADQFAFCVALWEALFGARPFAGDDRATLLRAKLMGELVRPRRRAVPQRVRVVLERGLRTDPSQRWPDMHALLDALDGARRRRTSLGVAIVAGGMALAAAIWAGMRAPSCHGDGLDAVWSATKRQQLEQRGVDPELLARIDAQASAWSRAREQTCGERAHDEATLDHRRACLGRRRAELLMLLQTVAADPTGLGAGTQAMRALAPVDACLDADRLYAAVPEPADPSSRVRVAEIREQLARAEALLRLARVADARRQLDLALAHVDATSFEPLQAEARVLRARVLFAEGRTVEAEAGFEDAVRLAVSAGADGAAVEAWQGLAWIAARDQGRDAEVDEIFTATEAAIDRAGGESAQRARLSYRRAVVAQRRGHLDHADALLTEAIRLLEGDALALDRLEILHAHVNLATARGELERAEELLDRARASAIEVYGEDHPALAAMDHEAGQLARARGDTLAAIDHLERSIRGFTRAGGASTTVAWVRANLATLLLSLGRIPQARREAALALAIRREALGPLHLETADSLWSMGVIDMVDGHPDRAVASLEQALWSEEHNLGTHHEQLSSTLAALGSARVRAGQLEEARATFERAAALRTPVLTTVACGLAEVEAREGNAAVAEGLAREALGRLADAGPRDRGLCRTALVRALSVSGDRDGEAHHELERALVELAGPDAVSAMLRDDLLRIRETLDPA